MLVSFSLILCLLGHVSVSIAADSCAGRCDTSPDFSKTCQCNSACQTYGDCCSDYDQLCNAANSCSARCGENYNAANPCHCNDRCEEFNNCCSDYVSQCSGNEDPLSTLAQALWDADVNRLEGSDLIFNKQAFLTNYAARNDLSPDDLFTYVNEAKLNTATWTTFRALLDNYNRFTGTRDSNTAAESQEIEDFLDAVFDTQVMTLTYQYMVDNGYFSTLSAFRAYVKDIWFTLYTRSGGTIDSSAFEHTFVGEVKNGKVSGYHNWLAFYEDENKGEVNYYGYTSDNEPNQILMQFRLDDNGSSYYKELASIIYGASPEFELALFTVCFRQNPNALSAFTMNGYTQRVQTWDYTGGYIGSAYFSV